MKTTLDAARELISRGQSVVPIAARQKKPLIEGWPDLRITAETAHQYFNGEPQNIGVILGEPSGGLVDVDLDSMEAVALADQFLPPTKAIFGRASKPKSHWLYRVPGMKTQKLQTPHDGMLVEIRSTKCQTVVPPSIHESGEQVAWHSEGEASAVTAEELTRAARKLAAAALLVRHFPEKGSRNETALALAGTLLRAGWSDEEAEHFIEVVATEAGCEDVPAKVKKVADTRAKIDAGAEVTGLPKLQELVGEATVAIGKFLRAQAVREARTAATSYGCNDVANGERFVRDHGKDVRYCYEFKWWFVWDGRRWTRDARGEIDRRAQATARAILKEAAGVSNRDQQDDLVKWAQVSQTRPRLEAMTWAARPALALSSDELDQHPLLLNVRNGTLDLRTGELGPHQRWHLMTQLAQVDYIPEATCPRFEAFLQRIMAEDAQMLGFLPRAVGYALTGESGGEQCLFLLHGDGANGKSTFLETLQAALGDYARPTEFRTLLQRDKSDGVRNDLAALRGLRLVTAVEPGQGKRLDEAVIKQLTGGDRITARFLYGEFFDFHPVFTLFLAANHKPEIRGVDEGIWRRVKLVPFDVTIPTAERDRHLLGKLKAELPGILTWAVRGCMEWQRNGLQEPEKVSAATAAYRHESDQLADFLQARCVRPQDLPDTAPDLLKVTSAALYAEYKKWAEEDAGTDPWQRNTFGRALAERGFKAEVERLMGRPQRVYKGLALRSDREEI